MKKILSVVLAGAMILGMSVSAFAKDVEFGKDTTNKDTSADVQLITFNAFTVVRDGKVVAADAKQHWFDANNSKDAKLKAGDVLYFPLIDSGAEDAHFGWSGLDKDWRIKINNAEYVASASFYKVDTQEKADATGCNVGDTTVKVVLEDDFDSYEKDEVKFFFYIYDRENQTSSDRVKVELDFKGYDEVVLYEDDLDWVVTVDRPTTYKYDEDAKAKLATFDYNGNAYYEVKLYPDEKYTTSCDVNYNKALSKEYDTDVEVMTFKGNFDRNGALVLPSSTDNKQVVKVVDGELVPVEAEYVKDHKFASGAKVDGYLVETDELGSYALIDEDIEIEVDEDKDDEDTSKPSSDKENPAMGANDFVGAAVALAVVSVAAAGALALKK